MFKPTILYILMCASFLAAEFEVKIGEIVKLEGIKKNYLSGYGLIAGLAGTGDSPGSLARSSISQYLSHHGIEAKTKTPNLATRNVAAVAVTAELSGFYEKGDVIDLQVASLGDAESLQGGLLLQATLKSASGKIYAVGSGIVTTVDGQNSSRGTVISGGIIEEKISSLNTFDFDNGAVFSLKEPGIENIEAIRKAVEENLSELELKTSDYKKFRLVKKSGKLSFKDISSFLSQQVTISPKARIVIDSKTGMVIVANNVRIDSSFVSLPEMSIEISGGTSKLGHVIAKNATVSDLASNLNEAGLDPAKIAAIFTALRRCGAINADIITQ